MDSYEPAVTAAGEAVTLDHLLERCRRLGPAFRERAAEADRLRTLPDKTVEDLHTSGVLKVFQPKRFGGFEMDWGAQIAIGEELARHCGSTAWIQSVVGSHAWVLGRMPIEIQEEIWGEAPDLLLATAFAGGRDTRVTAVDGGYRVSGRLRFSSGSTHAPWFLLGAQTPESRAGQYEMRLLAVPRREVTIIDSWNSLGLRATGSHDIAVDDVFVPTYRTTPVSSVMGDAAAGGRYHESYIYRSEFQSFFASNILGPLIGAAKGGLADYAAITKARIGAMFGETIAGQEHVQVRLSESAAEIRSAARAVAETVATLHRYGVRGERIPKPVRVVLRADSAYVARLSVQAIDRLVQQMGASGLSAENRVLRAALDLKAMASHQVLQWDHALCAYGRHALGLPTGDSSIDGAPD
jgi:3-hydroxy-9,10-secoandrosta-1,3,5(10)-triene-9,17-dione monooxygenase